MNYRVSLGFKHWETYEVNANSKDEAIIKAIELCENGEDSLMFNEERYSEIDEVTEV